MGPIMSGNMVSESLRGLLDWAREYAEEARRLCARCHLCTAACVSYHALRSPLYTPARRIEAAAKVLRGEPIGDKDLEVLYTCTMCGACTALCPYGIEVWRLVHAARAKLSLEGKQPPSLQAIAENMLRGGHSFTPSPEQPRRVLVEAARKAGVEPNSPGKLLYIPSPFETTLYPDVLEASLRALRSAGLEPTVSTKVLDFGGNAAFDASRPDAAVSALEKLRGVLNELGAEAVVLSGCGSDHKLAAYAEKLGLPGLGVKTVSLYEAVHGRLEAPGARLLFPSCGFARFEAHVCPLLRSMARDASVPRDKPPYTMCCGGGGGLNYLREKPLTELRNKIVAWRARKLAAQADSIVTPCIKCYTVIRHGLLLARLVGRVKVVHMSKLLIQSSY